MNKLTEALRYIWYDTSERILRNAETKVKPHIASPDVVIDDDEDAQQELEAEYLFLEESNREFVNFGTGLTDFSVHWY